MRQLFAAFAAALALAATAADTALAQQRSLPTTAAPRAADQTLGIAMMSAQVDKDGNLTGGAGAVGAYRQQTGVYFVVFNRSAEGCTHVAAIGSPTLYPGFVATTGNSGMFNGATYYGVSVFSRDPDGSPRDRRFHLTVFCSK